jgi:iron complex outermembrane receptor protein
LSRFVAAVIIGIILSPAISTPEEEKEHTERIVITAEDIEKMNVRTIVELLNHISGVHATESSVSLRGSYMVRVLLDGRPMNDPLSSHPSIRWDAITLSNIEKIEIFKGGGAVVFGDDTSGGVISIKTREVRESFGNIEIFGGNLDTQSYSLNYQQDILRPLGIGLSASWFKTDGFRTNDDMDKKTIGAKVGYEAGPRYNFDLSLDYSKEDSGSPGLPDFPTPNARTTYSIFGSSLLCKMGQLRSGTHFGSFEKEHRNPDTALETLLESWSVKQDLKSPIPIGRYGSIDTGLDFEIAQVSGNKVKSEQEEKYGLYASKETPLGGPPIKLRLGLRWNVYSEYDPVVNPEVGLTYDRANFSLQLAGIKTNNTPTFLQRYYESSSTIPNPDLGMEKAMNYSLSLSYHPKKSIEGTITLFFNEVKDRITYVRIDGGIGRYENIGEATLKGIEYSIKWKPHDSLVVKPYYDYLSAKDELTGNWLPGKPEHRLRLDLQYKPDQDLTFALDTKYVSKQYTRSDNTESVPGYFVADLRADYYLEKIRLFGKVENLFDREYLDGHGYPAPPRTWTIGLSYQF